MPAGWPEDIYARHVHIMKIWAQRFTHEKLNQNPINSSENNEERFLRAVELIESRESSYRSTGKNAHSIKQKAHRDLRAVRWKFLFSAFSCLFLRSIVNGYEYASCKRRRNKKTINNKTPHIDKGNINEKEMNNKYDAIVLVFAGISWNIKKFVMFKARAFFPDISNHQKKVRVLFETVKNILINPRS